MTDMSDQTVTQAWLIAIPTVLTAISGWINKRKTEKTVAASDVKTSQLIGDHNDNMTVRLVDLDTRVKHLEEIAGKSYTAQLMLLQRHTESMDRLSARVESTNLSLQKVLSTPDLNDSPTTTQAGVPVSPLGQAQGSSPGASGAPAPGKVVVVDIAPQPIGKVKWEK